MAGSLVRTLLKADQVWLSRDRQLAIDTSESGDTIFGVTANPEAVMSRPPLPPFTKETAAQKARMAEDAWNSRDPERVALAYTQGSRWRNRSEAPEPLIPLSPQAPDQTSDAQLRIGESQDSGFVGGARRRPVGTIPE